MGAWWSGEAVGAECADVILPTARSKGRKGVAAAGILLPMVMALVTLIVCLLCLGVHHEMLWLARSWAPRLPGPRRLRVIASIVMSIIAHLIEILIFAVGWAILIHAGLAELSIAEPDFEDLIYYSGTVYTSLGFGDLVPLGAARHLSVVEAVLGLVLIAWTASFSYFEMHEYWKLRDS